MISDLALGLDGPVNPNISISENVGREYDLLFDADELVLVAHLFEEKQEWTDAKARLIGTQKTMLTVSSRHQ